MSRYAGLCELCQLATANPMNTPVAFQVFRGMSLAVLLALFSYIMVAPSLRPVNKVQLRFG